MGYLTNKEIVVVGSWCCAVVGTIQCNSAHLECPIHQWLIVGQFILIFHVLASDSMHPRGSKCVWPSQVHEVSIVVVVSWCCAVMGTIQWNSAHLECPIHQWLIVGQFILIFHVLTSDPMHPRGSKCVWSSQVHEVSILVVVSWCCAVVGTIQCNSAHLESCMSITDCWSIHLDISCLDIWSNAS